MRLCRSDWFFIVAFLLFAAGLRIIGITFGQPDPKYAPTDESRQTIHLQTPLHPDEYFYTAIPVRMLLAGSLNPEFFENPSFLINTNLVTTWVTGAINELSLSDREDLNLRQYAPFPLYVIGRVYSALGGLLAVAATYGTVRLVAGRFAASSAGMLTIVSLPLVQHAHYATTSSLAAGFVALSVWASFASLKSTRHRRWLFPLAGAAAGLAAGNHYNTAAVALIVVVVGLLLMRRDHSGGVRKVVVAGWLTIPAVFLLSSPFIVLDFDTFFSQFRDVVGKFTSLNDARFGTPYGLLFEYRYLVVFGLGIPGVMASLLGLYAAWITRLYHKRFIQYDTTLLLVSILLLYLIVYSLIVLRTVIPGIGDQLIVPIVPTFAILAGLGMGWLVNHRAFTGALFGPILLLALIVQPLSLSVGLVWQFSHADTRELMQEWIYEHLPPGAHVHLFGAYNVPLDPARYASTETLTLDQLEVKTIQYWHNPGLTVYCVTEESCSAVR